MASKQEGMGVSFFYRHAGLVSVFIRERWAVHLLPRPTHWKWGHSVDPYVLCMDYWGLGPLLLIARLN